MVDKKPLPKKYKTYESHVIELATNGLSKTVIIQKLKLPPNIFYVFILLF